MRPGDSTEDFGRQEECAHGAYSPVLAKGMSANHALSGEYTTILKINGLAIVLRLKGLKNIPTPEKRPQISASVADKVFASILSGTFSKTRRKA